MEKVIVMAAKPPGKKNGGEKHTFGPVTKIIWVYQRRKGLNGVGTDIGASLGGSHLVDSWEGGRRIRQKKKRKAKQYPRLEQDGILLVKRFFGLSIKCLPEEEGWNDWAQPQKT